MWVVPLAIEAAAAAMATMSSAVAAGGAMLAGGGITAAGVGAIAQGVALASTAIGAIGLVTGNSTLQKIGLYGGLAGGVTAGLAGAASKIGASAVAGNAAKAVAGAEGIAAGTAAKAAAGAEALYPGAAGIKSVGTQAAAASGAANLINPPPGLLNAAPGIRPSTSSGAFGAVTNTLPADASLTQKMGLQLTKYDSLANNLMGAGNGYMQFQQQKAYNQVGNRQVDQARAFNDEELARRSAVTNRSVPGGVAIRSASGGVLTPGLLGAT